jgi:glutathione synthase/RimK-type ligase-like ATP-grasp enzyme
VAVPGTGRNVALATSAEIPEGDEDFEPLIGALAAECVGAEAAVWDDPAVDWTRFDLVLPRATWDYAERREAFLAWAASVPWVLNPLEILEWNTDKERYLTDLAARGVPVVPTEFIAPGGELEPPDEPFVVKPAISAGGRNSARFEASEAEAARELVARIQAAGRTAMVQPFLGEHEETALVYIDGAYSHAVRRRVPLPAAGARDVFFLDEELGTAEATAEERAVAEKALPEGLLYGRVDLMGGLVLELEIAEPSLYLTYAGGAAARFAAAISQRLRVSPENGRTRSQ